MISAQETISEHEIEFWQTKDIKNHLVHFMARFKPVAINTNWVIQSTQSVPASWTNSKWCQWLLKIEKTKLGKYLPELIRAMIHVTVLTQSTKTYTLPEKVADSIAQQIINLEMNGLKPRAITVGFKANMVLRMDKYSMNSSEGFKVAEILGLPVYTSALLTPDSVIVTQ